MTRAEADKMAEDMSSNDVWCNLAHAKGIRYRHATLTKLKQIIKEWEQYKETEYYLEDYDE